MVGSVFRHALDPIGTLASGPLLPRIVGPLAFIVIVAVVGGVVIFWTRRQLYGEEKSNDFTLDGLERMRAAGQLTEEEFRQARRILIEQLRQANAPTEESDGS